MRKTELETPEIVAMVSLATILSTTALIIATAALIVLVVVLVVGCKSFNMPDNWHNPLSVQDDTQE